MPIGVWTKSVRASFLIAASIILFFQSAPSAFAFPPALPPTLQSVGPSDGKQGQIINVVLQGTNFLQGDTAVNVSGSDVTVTGVQVASATSLFATFTIGATAAAGGRNVTVTTSGGTSGAAVFTINAANVPTLTSISVPNSNPGQSVSVTLTGTNFVQNGTFVNVLGTGVGVSAVNVLSSTSLTATLTVATGATVNNRTVSVTVAGVQSNGLNFSVLGAPTLTSAAIFAPQGSTFNFNLTGTNFTFGQTTAAVSGSGVTINSVTNSTSPTVRTVSITVASNAAPGSRNVTVTTPAGTSGPGPLYVIVAGTYMISTIAGKGAISENTSATAQSLPWSRDVARDSSGNLYIASRGGNKIYKRTPGGLLSTFAGTGIYGEVGDGGPAAAAQLSGAISVAVDASNNVYILENNQIRKVSAADGTISMFAGRGTQGNFNLAFVGFAGDGGPAAFAEFNGPTGITFDAVGNLYVIDTGNNRIRKIATDGTITTVAGNGTFGYGGDNGQATAAQLALDGDTVKLAFDAAGNLYIPDSLNNRVRRVTPGGVITTIVGTGAPDFTGDTGPAVSATLNFPTAVAIDGSGNIFISDAGNNRIRKIGTDLNINTVAGNGGFLFNGDGPDATMLQLSNPAGLVADASGNVYFADEEANRIRMLDTTGALSTIAGNAGFGGDSAAATDAQIYKPQGIAADTDGNILIADAANARIRKILAASGNISTVAGNGSFTVSGDNGPATSAGLGIPFDVAAGVGGVFYIAATNADFGGTDSRVWKVGSDGTITTIAGGSVSGYGGDNAPAVSALLNAPQGIATDAAGNVYIADTENNRVRRINASDQKIVTVAGNGTKGANGDGGPATSAQLDHPTKLALDVAGNLYIVDSNNGRIRKVATDGTISTFYAPANTGPGPTAVAAANGAVFVATNSQIVRLFDSGGLGGVAGFPFPHAHGISGDNGPGFGASVDVQSLAVTPSGNVIVADSDNNAVRQLTMPAANSGALSVSPGSIYSRGGGLTNLTTNVTVFPGGYFPWTATATVTTPPGGTWLSLVQTSGTGTAAVGVTFDQSGLGPGTYTGNLVFTSPNAVNGSFTVPITMTIVSAVIGTNPQSFVLYAAGGFVGFNPTMLVFNGGSGGNLSVTAAASVSTPPAGNWLSISPTSLNAGNFQNSALLTSTINTNGLAVGTYTGAITLTAAGAANTPSTISVTLNVQPQTLPPGLSSIIPANGSQGQTVNVTLQGFNFVNGGTTVAVSGGGVTVTTVNVTSPTTLVATLVIDPGATVSARNISATTSAGTTGNQIFTILGPPTLTSVTPNTAGQGRTVVISVSGTNFPQTATTLSISGTGVTLIGFTSATSTTVRAATLKIDSDAPVGNRSLTVSTPAGTSNSVIFSITGPQGYVISAAAGRSVIAENQSATAQPLPPPNDVAFDSAGNLYIAVTNGNKVLKVTPGGIVSTFAGVGINGGTGDGGPATSALLNAPRSVVVDSTGNVLIADTNNHRIRKVATDGTITTLAGTGTASFTGDGGPAQFATLNTPSGLGIDPAGNVYIADVTNRRIRKIDTTGVISTVAGTGVAGYFGDGLQATLAQLNLDNQPQKLAIDGLGNIYIADTLNQRVRKVATDGTISTIAGTGTAGFSNEGGPAAAAMVNSPRAVFVDSGGIIYVADSNNNRIRQIVNGLITTLAGNGSFGFNGDGPTATSQQLSAPIGMAMDGFGNILIADAGSNRARMRSTAGAISTVAGSGGVFSGDGVSATTTELYNPNAVAFDLSGNLLIADSRNFRIRKVDGGGTISTIVGTGVNGTSPDGTLGSSAQINFMNDITVDAAGNLYLVGGNRVRKVNASDGKINTIAGNGSAGFSDNIPAVTAMMNNPNGIALDAAGNIYIADTNNNRVRKVTIADGNITTIAGNGTQGANGDNGPATSAQLSGPRKVAVDSAGNVYIADNGNNRIRRVAASDQTITTFSTFGGVSVSISGGSIYIASFSSIQQIFPDSTLMTVGGLGFGIYGDNGPALTASLANTGIGISPSGSVYVADAADNVVRKMNPVGGGFAVLSVTPVSINNRFGNLSTSGVTTETIALNGTGVFSWTATSSVNSFPGSEWLSLSADSGTAGAPLFVTVNPAGLAPGFYNGSVTITSPQAVNGSVVVPVTMTVLSSTLSVIPTVISASTNVNGANPAQQNITVTNGGSGPPFGYNAAAVVLTPQGGSWLTVSPGSGTTAATPITAFFNVTGLGSGIYSGQIRLTSAQADNSAVVIPVTLTINPTAAPTLTSVSPSSGAPGQLVTVTLTGTNFAPSGNTIAIDGTGVTSGIATLMSGTSLIATFTISSGATAADHNVTVSTANGSSGSVTFTVGLAKRMRSQLTSVP